MKKMKAPRKAIVITIAENMPYDRHGMHASGRKVYDCTTCIWWSEYIDAETDGLYYFN